MCTRLALVVPLLKRFRNVPTVLLAPHIEDTPKSSAAVSADIEKPCLRNLATAALARCLLLAIATDFVEIVKPLR